MNTEHKQKIFFNGIEHTRIVYNTIYTSHGCRGKVDINGMRYEVQEDIARGVWHVIAPDTNYIKRDRIPSQVRMIVLKRDNHMCLMCGSVEDLELDHIHPHAHGGSSNAENLQTLCRACNAAKSTSLVFGAKQRKSYGRMWHPVGEKNLASRLIRTLLRHGYTYKQIAEESGLPQQSVTKLEKMAQGSYENVKSIEALSIQLLPELRVLAKFVKKSHTREE